MGRMGVFEGDATLLMTLWALQHLDADRARPTISQVDPEQQAALDKMPKILSDTLLFPYSTGALFVQRAQMTGGWDAVDAFYDRMPVSTEQIMHPEKYAADEKPVDVKLPADLAKDLGKGWSVPLDDTFGEFQMGTWLRDRRRADGDGRRCRRAGWGGDRLAVIDGPDDAWAVAMHTVWDTEADAAEFETAATTALKTAGGVAQVVPGDGRHDALGRGRLGRRDASRRSPASSASPARSVTARPPYIDSGAEIPSRRERVRERDPGPRARARGARPIAPGSSGSTTRASR